ncbi:MAG: hydroxysqualene dehydroxylase HpnE [Caulobacterales bacterium]|nr:hydroxysqualene dehydroxylase HpnE [Caulobacterales bacterium]
MTAPAVHVIGAGVAGLAAAARLAAAGLTVRVYESAPRAGGRCRSYHDPVLDRLIDNGNHLVLSGNRSIAAYAEEIGAVAPFDGADRAAAFPFVDLATGERWTVRPNAGPIPWWALAPARRPPRTSLADLASGFGLPFAGSDRTVADLVGGEGVFFERFWEPLTVAALNTPPARGQARLLWVVLAETFLRGEAHCRPLIAREGLGPALIDPALARLAELGAQVALNARARALSFEDGRVAAIDMGDERVAVGPRDQVVLAVSPARAKDLAPVSVPGDGEPIVNLHYRLAGPPAPETPAFIGLLSATAHWAFLRGDVASVTISSGVAEAEEDREALSARVWEEIRVALRLADAAPAAARVVTEKRATFDQSPASVARRPKTETEWANLVLAGDWVDTGLPATLESAARSGHMAAAAALTRARG